MMLAVIRALRGFANVIEVNGARTHLKNVPDNVSDAYDFIASFEYGSIQPSPVQKRNEILQLLERLRADPPRRILELGTYRGGTLFSFTRIAAPDAVFVTVDMPSGPFGGGYPRSWAWFFKAFARDEQTIHMVRGDTHSDDTFVQVKRLVGGEETVDFLFIDADHTYEGVRSDYERYGCLVRKGGVIAFHDIVSGNQDFVGGVPRFWRELRNSGANTEEIVENWGQGGYGIGLVCRT